MNQFHIQCDLSLLEVNQPLPQINSNLPSSRRIQWKLTISSTKESSQNDDLFGLS